MTKLSVNLNKIALLRNSRGRDYPNVLEFAEKFISLGAHGVTVHPRQDERHISKQDAHDLGEYFKTLNGPELNIEGYPSEDFLSMVEEIQPDQCTLVPDSPTQLTSDHGWNLKSDAGFVKASINRLHKRGVRSAIFLDPDLEQITLVPATKGNRIELYTERYASTFDTSANTEVLQKYNAAATQARHLHIGVNAGHDLNLRNLPSFLKIGGILEVSIGHELMIECIEAGMPNVLKEYLDICAN